MSREVAQLAHLLWTHFGLNPIDYSKLTEAERTFYADEIYRIESEKRMEARKAKWAEVKTNEQT